MHAAIQIIERWQKSLEQQRAQCRRRKRNVRIGVHLAQGFRSGHQSAVDAVETVGKTCQDTARATLPLRTREAPHDVGLLHKQRDPRLKIIGHAGCGEDRQCLGCWCRRRDDRQLCVSFCERFAKLAQLGGTPSPSPVVI